MSDTKIDIETMGRLSSALAFVTSPDDPAVVAMRAAVKSGTAKDIKHARTLFLRISASHRKAALATLMDDD